MTDRGAVNTDTLLKGVLALVVVWLILDIVTFVGDFPTLTPFKPILGLVIVILIFLKILDQI